MKILYVASKYDYGIPEQGYSFEHANFYDALFNMGHHILYFDHVGLWHQVGPDAMNRRLREVVRAERPDVMFTVLFRDELDPAVVKIISESGQTLTVNWFTDDHWRFDNFSQFWAPSFNFVVTTAASALPKYAQIGYQNVIKSQWGCNHFLYRKLDLPLQYDVTFVGQPHGNRRQVIQALRESGISVRVWGTGWDTGRLTQEELIEVFNQSRINLNLSNASTPTISGFSYQLRQALARTASIIPGGKRLKALAKGWLFKLRGQQQNLSGTADQIKGRNFEVPGCGQLLLTGKAENLGEYYGLDQEVMCFDNLGDLIEKARYYLAHDDERTAIAEAAYQRTLNEHTYVHRFTAIFHQMGLDVQPYTGPAPAHPTPGTVTEIDA
jgi:spore maturation protein CgeB